MTRRDGGRFALYGFLIIALALAMVFGLIPHDSALQVVFGILGLSLVVLVHEVGHYVAARLVGIRVETFSVGFGRRLIGFTRGETDYRISLIPLGGYCRFYGEESFREAVEHKLDRIPAGDGEFYAAAPWRRIVVALAGPAANILLAFLTFTAILAIGYEEQYWEPRVILYSEIADDGVLRPADVGGLKSGDLILAVNGTDVTRYGELSEHIALSPDEDMVFTVRREGRILDLTVRPELNKEAGYATIGVYVWLEPVVFDLQEGSAADAAGLEIGDRIVAADGRDVPHQTALYAVLNEAAGRAVTLEIQRGGSSRELVLDTGLLEESGILGITFPYVSGRSEDMGFFRAAGRGMVRTVETFGDILRGLRMLFMGISLQNAVTGPAGIIMRTGEVIQSSFSRGFGPGMLWSFRFLAFISISLAFMNLLPIPVMDGGQIILHGIEIIQRHPVRPGSVYRYQIVGTIIVVFILVAASAGDVMRAFSGSGGG